MTLTPTHLLWAFSVGLAAAVLYVYYVKRVPGGFVRKLLAIDACSEESAVSPESIGARVTSMIKHSMRPGTSLAGTVLKTKDGLYYVNPSKVKMAEHKYREPGISVPVLIATLAVFTVIVIILSLVMPEDFEGLFGFAGESAAITALY